MGKPANGKTTSLMNLPDQKSIAYLNADLKELPFKSDMRHVNLTDPKIILTALDQIEAAAKMKSGVLDTVTFLMNQFEKQHVITHRAANGKIDTMAGWGEYSKFYMAFMHKIKAGTKSYAVLAHEADKMNEKEMVLDTYVPIKGAIGKVGIEADFTTIVSAKKISIAMAEEWSNDLLNITDIEREDGFKYVFQTRIDSSCVGEKMRSAMGLWDRREKFIDNDLNKVFTRLREYYK
jgi:hypothetical protein